MAWLGFGISLGLFLLVWAINILVLSALSQSNSPDSAPPISSLYVLLIFFGVIPWILGLTFSIVGLVSAYKNGLKKSPGIWGIVLCCACFLSLFAPIFYPIFSAKKTPVEVNAPLETENVSDKEDVILYIDDLADVRCFKKDENYPVKMSVFSSSSFKREFKYWLETNHLDKNVSIVIKYDKDTNYSYIANVIEALNELGMKNYVIKNS